MVLYFRSNSNCCFTHTSLSSSGSIANMHDCWFAGRHSTGLIHTKLKIDALLAGILVMTGLYSINLIILGRSNVPLINIAGVFSFFSFFSDDIYQSAFRRFSHFNYFDFFTHVFTEDRF